MAEAINCPGCGADNMLPEGKTSMYCAFCGKPIEKILPKGLGTERRINKSKIIDNKLAYTDRGIESLDEIIELYSDTELNEVRHLNLSGNKIKTLKGISRFKLYTLNLSNNDIKIIDEFPKLDYNDIFYSGYSHSSNTFMNFSDNKNLEIIADDVFEYINSTIDSEHYVFSFSLDFKGCPNFNFECLCKLDFFKISLSPTKGMKIMQEIQKLDTLHKDANNFVARLEQGSTAIIFTDSNKDLPESLKEMGFVNTGNKWELKWVYGNEKGNKNNNNNNKCFIATATMGSYNNPIVIELRHFRDEWILKKSWGAGFVNWYYNYGAKASKVIEKSFVLKKISYLLIVKPLVYLSRIVKYK